MHVYVMVQMLLRSQKLSATVWEWADLVLTILDPEPRRRRHSSLHSSTADWGDDANFISILYYGTLIVFRNPMRRVAVEVHVHIL